MVDIVEIHEIKKNNMSKPQKKTDSPWLSRAKTAFLGMIAEINLAVFNLVDVFFVTRFLGADGAAAFEIVMPCR